MLNSICIEVEEDQPTLIHLQQSLEWKIFISKHHVKLGGCALNNIILKHTPLLLHDVSLTRATSC